MQFAVGVVVLLVLGFASIVITNTLFKVGASEKPAVTFTIITATPVAATPAAAGY